MLHIVGDQISNSTSLRALPLRNRSNFINKKELSKQLKCFVRQMAGNFSPHDMGESEVGVNHRALTWLSWKLCY